MKKEFNTKTERKLDWIVDGKLSYREFFRYDGNPENNALPLETKMHLNTFVVTLKYDDVDTLYILEEGKDYEVVATESTFDAYMRNAYPSCEIQLKDIGTDPADITVIRPWVASLEHEKRMIALENLPDDPHVGKGAHKSWYKGKNSKWKAFKEWLHSSRLIAFTVDMILVCAIFSTAVNVFGLTPANAISLMMVIVAVLSFLINSR